MEKEIKRDYYLEQLVRRKGNGLIKIVTGIRRCGKSYLLRTLFKKHLIESGVDESYIIEMAFRRLLALCFFFLISACNKDVQ